MYKDEEGRECNPVDLQLVEKRVAGTATYYYREIQKAWELAKQHRKAEELVKLQQEVEEIKEYIKTTWTEWCRTTLIHGENPNPPPGFDSEECAPNLKVKY